MAKKSKKETRRKVRQGFPGEGSPEEKLENGLLLYLVVFLAGELRAEVFPWGSLNSLTFPSLVLASPRGLQFPLPVTQPPDNMP